MSSKSVNSLLENTFCYNSGSLIFHVKVSRTGEMYSFQVHVHTSLSSKLVQIKYNYVL